MVKKSDVALAAGAAVAVTGAVLAVNTITRNDPNQFFSDADIARFLTQATFGPTDADIAAVKTFGGYDAWINDQMDVSKHALFDTVAWANSRVGKSPTVEMHYAFVEAFWIAIRNPDVTNPANPTGPKIAGPHTDLLRQRVQFALSQISRSRARTRSSSSPGPRGRSTTTTSWARTRSPISASCSRRSPSTR